MDVCEDGEEQTQQDGGLSRGGRLSANPPAPGPKLMGVLSGLNVI